MFLCAPCACCLCLFPPRGNLCTKKQNREKQNGKQNKNPSQDVFHKAELLTSQAFFKRFFHVTGKRASLSSVELLEKNHPVLSTFLGPKTSPILQYGTNLSFVTQSGRLPAIRKLVSWRERSVPAMLCNFVGSLLGRETFKSSVLLIVTGIFLS